MSFKYYILILESHVFGEQIIYFVSSMGNCLNEHLNIQILVKRELILTLVPQVLNHHLSNMI